MARKKLEPATQVVVAELSTTPAATAAQEAELRQRQELVVERFGGGLPWHPDHYEAAIRGELRRGCESFLRAGRLLVVARECAAYGEWDGILDRLGMARDQAWRMMEAARRIAALPNVASTQHLLAAADSQTKLIELLSLPPEQFAELAEKGETHGLDLDDVEQLSVKELRAKLREARADMAAKDERAEKREREIERKTAEIAKLKRAAKAATPDEVGNALLADLTGEVLGLQGAILADDGEATSLKTRVRAVVEYAQEQGADVMPYLAGVFAQLERQLWAVRDEFGIPQVAAGDPHVEAKLTLGEG